MSPAASVAEDFTATFAELAAIGRRADGWHRHGFSPEDAAARDWFAAQCADRGLSFERDRFGNCFGWWGTGGRGALLLCSHLDTVPAGGAYDGALGVVSALCAVSAAASDGARPGRPVAVGAFVEEEGGGFGLPCLGSRLATGTAEPARVLGHEDLVRAARADGLAPADWFAAEGRLLPERVAVAVELHVEQGRALAELGAPLGVATGVWPHGRWRMQVRGESNHAGTTRLADRRDPVLVLAAAVQAARECAADVAGVATVGRVAVEPNATNVIAGQAACWLDARAPDEAALARLVSAWAERVAASAARHGCGEPLIARESFTPAVTFDPKVAGLLAEVVDGLGWPAPRLATAAGHDAAVLASRIPAGMLFVRNPTGASHTPAESAAAADCVTGVAALAALVDTWTAG